MLRLSYFMSLPMYRIASLKLSLILLLLASPLLAGDGSTHMTPTDVPLPVVEGSSDIALPVYHNPDDTLVLSAPPHETPTAGRNLYDPIARYLSAVTGKHVQYKHPGTLATYRAAALNGAYDIVFDGSAIGSELTTRLNYHVIASARTVNRAPHVFLAGPRVPDADRARMTRALSADSALEPTARLRATLDLDHAFSAASEASLATVLANRE